jgi:hypothetical protein
MNENDQSLAGRYRLLERIGSGGMGVVYRGEQLALGRSVAIKMLHPELVQIPELLERFHIEARAASRLCHPGSVTIYDYGVTADGRPFLVMEYVTGHTLSALIRERWPVPLTTVVVLGLQILAAVGNAHAAGVIHGDIKSDNVLIETSRAGVERAKIVDYGLARIVDEGAAGAYGTPEYMAPEVACGRPVNESSDLYSIGATLYEMLTGTPPFTGASADEVLDRQVADVVIPPSTRQPSRDIPWELEVVIMKALAKSAKDRHTDALEFAAALDMARPLEANPVQRCGCGARLPARARVCMGCGEPLGVVNPPRFVDASTRSWDPVAAQPELLARGSDGADPPQPDPDDGRLGALRAAIGEAITRGAIDDIADGYLELSGALATTVGVRAAAHELEEGINILTGGEGPRARRAPSRLWKLLIELARLHAADGDRARARAAAAHAHFQAVSCESTAGQDHAAALLEDLRP